MKKITIILLFVLGAFTVSMAQTTAPQVNNKEAVAAQKKADKAAKKLEKKQQHDAMEAQKTADKNANVVKSSTGLNKDGTPDKRLKANKQPKVQAQVQPQTQVQAQPQAQVQPQTQVTARPQPQAKSQIHANNTSTTDKAVSTDAKGRTIYEGPRGGHYYIDKNGNKEYIKK